jgi:electron transfer flavoprotein beta subunit
LATKSLADLGLDAAEFTPDKAKVKSISLEMPAERAAGRIINGDLDTAGKAIELVRVLHEEAKVI